MSFRAVCCLPKNFIFSLIFSSALMLLFQLPAYASQSVTLSWDTTGDPNVGGYRIYYGVQSRNYTRWMDAGNVTNATVAGLAAGTTYYFAATTYDTYGNESDYSNETVYRTPPASIETGVGVTLTPAVQAGGRFGFDISGTTGAVYVVQASTDLVNWTSIQTNIAPFAFVDAGVAGFKQRFFRTVSLTP